MKQLRIMGLCVAGVLALGLSIPMTSYGAVAPLLNVPYGSDALQIMDIYPASSSASPLVVLVHGGGWATGDKKTHHLEAEKLQAQGFAVFNIDYRLDSTTVSAFAMEVEDVEAAIRYAIAHAGSYGASPAKVVLIGGSAGGQLVGSAAELLNTSTVGTVKGVVTLSGASDFTALLRDDRRGLLDPHFAKNVPQALGCELETTCKTPGAEAWAIQWSPADQVTASNCPRAWLIFNSKDEGSLDQPNAMTNALKRKHCQVTKDILPGAKHAFGYWPTVKPIIVSFIRAL